MKKWSDLSEYLLLKIDLADAQKSKANPTFSREEMWNHYMGMCISGGDEDLSIKTAHILIGNVKKDF